MTRLTNSIEHRKCKRVKPTRSVTDVLNAKRMALDLADNMRRTPPIVMEYAKELYRVSKEEAK